MNVRQAIIPFYLLLCLLLGGASAAGYWANMILQLLALPILVWALIERRPEPMPPAARQLLAICALGVLLIAVQLIPFPPEFWAGLPGHGQFAEMLRAMGVALPWLPLSLAPSATIASALWLLPALAVLVGMVRLEAYRPLWITWILIAFAFASILLGTLQISGEQGSAWYLYAISNFGMTSGFFANSNHLATLLLATIPFVANLARPRGGRRMALSRSSGRLFILAGILMVISAGLLMNGSLAGLGLLLPVMAGSVLALFFGSGVRWWAPAGGLVLLVAGAALALSAPLQNELANQNGTPTELARTTIFPLTWRAARDFLPAGSGIGTFAELYRQYEPPGMISRTYINHAHNDYLELLLETGVAGIALVLLFLAWWLVRTGTIWSAAGNGYARAATIASAAILAHSIVDYPLRTAALSALFAACCAMMVLRRPAGQSIEVAETAKAKPRHVVAN